MNKETFQRYALVTIVVLLAAIASQRVMTYARAAVFSNHDHDVMVRNVDVEIFADEQRALEIEARALADEQRALDSEARSLADEARALSFEHFHISDGVCDVAEEARALSAEARELRNQIRVEIR